MVEIKLRGEEAKPGGARLAVGYELGLFVLRCSFIFVDFIYIGV